MRKLILIAGGAMILASTPSFAKPDHAKHQGSGHGNKGAGGYGAGGCPPGLAKKNNGCIPPGRAKKLYNIGQRYPGDYGYRWNYDQIPYDLRRQYNFDPQYRYYYGDGYLYRVDPRTMLISQVVSALLR